MAIPGSAAGTQASASLRAGRRLPSAKAAMSLSSSSKSRMRPRDPDPAVWGASCSTKVPSMAWATETRAAESETAHRTVTERSQERSQRARTEFSLQCVRSHGACQITRCLCTHPLPLTKRYGHSRVLCRRTPFPGSQHNSTCLKREAAFHFFCPEHGAALLLAERHRATVVGQPAEFVGAHATVVIAVHSRQRLPAQHIMKPACMPGARDCGEHTAAKGRQAGDGSGARAGGRARGGGGCTWRSARLEPSSDSYTRRSTAWRHEEEEVDVVMRKRRRKCI